MSFCSREQQISGISKPESLRFCLESRTTISQQLRQAQCSWHMTTPSMTAGIVAENIAGILTEVGGRTSHSAILARAMEIPAVLSIDGICTSVKNGDRVVLNGTSGEAIVNPDAETEQKFAELLEEYKKEKELLKKFAGVPTVSADGTKVELVCNIGKPEDAKESCRV